MNNPGQTDFPSMCKRQGKRGLSLIVHRCWFPGMDSRWWVWTGRWSLYPSVDM